jgi:hypothetical protein
MHFTTHHSPEGLRTQQTSNNHSSSSNSISTLCSSRSRDQSTEPTKCVLLCLNITSSAQPVQLYKPQASQCVLCAHAACSYGSGPCLNSSSSSSSSGNCRLELVGSFPCWGVVCGLAVLRGKGSARQRDSIVLAVRCVHVLGFVPVSELRSALIFNPSVLNRR